MKRFIAALVLLVGGCNSPPPSGPSARPESPSDEYGRLLGEFHEADAAILDAITRLASLQAERDLYGDRMGRDRLEQVDGMIGRWSDLIERKGRENAARQSALLELEFRIAAAELGGPAP